VERFAKPIAFAKRQLMGIAEFIIGPAEGDPVGATIQARTVRGQGAELRAKTRYEA
jgi:hypothetical protein